MNIVPTAEDGTSDARSRERDGFSLIEVLVVLAIFAALVGALIPLGYQIQTSADEMQTRQRLENLKQAMVGQGPGKASTEFDQFAFLGDIGELPDSLPELVRQGPLPSHNVSSTKRLGAGWNGPYIWPGFEEDTANLTRDAFGRSLQYRPDGFGSGEDTVIAGDTVDALLKSAGEDGAFGTGDDLSIRILRDETTADIVGFVSDTAGSALDSIDVQVTFRRDGSLVDTTVTTDSQGRYEVDDLPFGRIRTAALASGSGSTGGSKIEIVDGSVATDGQDNRNVRLLIFNAETTPITFDAIILDWPKPTNEARYYSVMVGDAMLADATSKSASFDSGDTINIGDVSVPASGSPGGTVLASRHPILDRRSLRVSDLEIIPGGGDVVDVLLRWEHFITKQELSNNPNDNINMSGKTLTATFLNDGAVLDSLTFSTP